MKISKKMATFFLSAVMLISCCASLPAVAASETVFSDVSSGDWFYTPVKYCVSHNLVTGTSTTSFSPYATMTRGQFVTVLGRMDAVAPSKGTTAGKFTDVSGSDYFAVYVYWAVNAGIASGTTPTTFSPNSPVTREQMATFVSRYLKYKNATLADSTTAPASFSDADQIDSYAIANIDTLRKVGLISGDQNENVSPKKVLSRAEAVAVFMRLRDKLIDAGFTMKDPDPATKVTPTEDANGDWFKVKSDSITMNVGDSVQQLDLLTDNAKAVIKQNLYCYSVTSSAPAVVKATYTYRDVEAVAKGTAKLAFSVYWTDDNGKDHMYNASISVTVSDNQNVSCDSILTTAAKSTLAVGETTQLTTAFTPANTTDKKVGYSSSDETVATVDSNGLVTAVGEGSATIYSWSTNARTCRTEITVSGTTLPPATFTVTSEYVSEFNAEFTRLLNAERISEGLTGAVFSSTMQPASQLRANEMAQTDTLTHTRPDGTPFRTAFAGVTSDTNGVTECGWECCTDAEEMLQTTPQSLAQQAFAGWMNSAPHKAILMSSTPAEMPESCGVAFNGTVVYATCNGFVH